MSAEQSAGTIGGTTIVSVVPLKGSSTSCLKPEGSRRMERMLSEEGRPEQDTVLQTHEQPISADSAHQLLKAPINIIEKDADEPADIKWNISRPLQRSATVEQRFDVVDLLEVMAEDVSEDTKTHPGEEGRGTFQSQNTDRKPDKKTLSKFPSWSVDMDPNEQTLCHSVHPDYEADTASSRGRFNFASSNMKRFLRSASKPSADVDSVIGPQGENARSMDFSDDELSRTNLQDKTSFRGPSSRIDIPSLRINVKNVLSIGTNPNSAKESMSGLLRQVPLSPRKAEGITIHPFPSATLVGSTDLVTEEEFLTLLSFLPEKHMNADVIQLYDTTRHQQTLKHFYKAVSKTPQTLLLVKDASNYVFGAFCTHLWQPENRYYGDGDSFLFTLKPELKLYKWSRLNLFFQFSNSSSIGVGGGYEGDFGIFLDADLRRGFSDGCETFNSQRLSAEKEFECIAIEVWGLLQRKRH
eukprot:Plantae.Rhodophyta-Purpureofilum_apyrenoidigerum.ctg17048.p1 GENE.Plantae.Rhodophyta-Purpureofilum_apyrenoidigerum.ctg17048~~Plantae.Rhodophyta-Purpureofilum_apyrenoidigerum.ctg17048.p1  ORF type:complete len:510 (+),score=84.99 Plantae.Rhodophyta-Purpureofilum_apyrenoidigerum.ctg17048:127-1530(+)